MKYITIFFMFVLSCNLSVIGGESKESETALTQFSETTFGVHFSYPGKISTIYNPHGGANRVYISYDKKPIGGLAIGSLPKSIDTKEFISQGKEYYKKNFGVSSVQSGIYKTPNEISFHYIKLDVKQNGVDYILERYIFLYEKKVIWGTYSFEFLLPKNDYIKQKAAIKTVIDTFKIKNK